MATAAKQEQASTRRLQVRRVFEASPERLFRAWTTPEELKRWHAPGALTTPLAEVDLRVGGTYRIHMMEPGGKEHRVSGTYRTVEPPRRLVYTWKWEDDPTETVVTLEFLPKGKGTELVLTHEGFAAEERRASHEHGWTAIFDKFGAQL